MRFFSGIRAVNLRVFMLGVMALCGLAPSAISGPSFGVMPMQFTLKAPRPGARVTNDIEVYNNGDVPLQISVSTGDWTLSSKGELIFDEAGKLPDSCASWIQVNPVQFSIEPKKSIRVRCSIATPANQVGEKRAMIFFLSRPIPLKGEQNLGLMVAARVGSMLFMQPAQPPAPEGKILSMELPEATEAKLKILFENTGLISDWVNGTVEVTNAQGQLITKGKVDQRRVVLPGSQRELWVNFDEPLRAGTYTFKAVLDYGSKSLAGAVMDAAFTPLPPAEKAPVPASNPTAPATPQ